MSKKSRERREKRKHSKPDDYMTNGIFEMARFGKNIIMRNNSTPEQHAAHMQYLSQEYPSKYKEISDKLVSLKEKVLRCNPYNLLMYLRSMALATQMNIFSEIDYSAEANSIIRAQEYIQSIIISSGSNIDESMTEDDEDLICSQIVSEFQEIYNEFRTFYHYWGAHIKNTTGISNDRLTEIVESQYMYWVRGNRYQVFELEPLKSLLPPHSEILQKLFGVTSDEIINGLEKLRYSLSQGYADALMELGAEYDAFVKAIDSGTDPDTIMNNSRDRATEIVGRVFGSELINVKRVTGWDDRFIDLLSSEIAEHRDFWDGDDFSGWPIVRLPVSMKPLIKLDGVSYAFLYYALFDNVYRIIQRGILNQDKGYLAVWKDKQTQASEEMVCNLFLKLLPGAEAHIGNYYPVKNSVKQMNENDILLIFHDYLFVIEVKAGSFPSTPPITDFNAHIEAYHNLAEVADTQCSRTIDYIKKDSAAQFYNREKAPTFQVSDYNSFKDVFSFSVTVDNFNEFAAKAEKLSVISLKEETIVISVDDLLAYAGYFDSPIQFLHYLKQRKAAMRVPQYQMHDELDHLGLYIDRNLYALNSTQYRDVKNVVWQGFRQPIDEYFNWMYTAPSKAVKPKQNIPPVVSAILTFLDSNISSNNIIFSHFLLDLATDAKEDLSEQILYGLKRQREIHRQVPIVAFGDIKYCIFISLPEIKEYSLQEQQDYAYAAASRNDAIPVMLILLKYDSTNSLQFAEGIGYCFYDAKETEKERLKKLGQEKAKDWVELSIRKNGKIGRNDYCPCGSGKKYKHCCEANRKS